MVNFVGGVARRVFNGFRCLPRIIARSHARIFLRSRSSRCETILLSLLRINALDALGRMKNGRSMERRRTTASAKKKEKTETFSALRRGSRSVRDRSPSLDESCEFENRIITLPSGIQFIEKFRATMRKCESERSRNYRHAKFYRIDATLRYAKISYPALSRMTYKFESAPNSHLESPLLTVHWLLWSCCNYISMFTSPFSALSLFYKRDYAWSTFKLN